MRFVPVFAALVAAGSAHAGVTNFAASLNGGVATQISNWASISGAEKAIDGDRNGNYFGLNSIAHTNSHPGAWWQCSFAQISNIDDLIVFNRTDGFGSRINPFTVSLYLGDSVVWTSAGNTFAADIVEPNVSGMTFHVGGVEADRVRVQLDGTNYLQLAEVEAWGIPAPGSLLPVIGMIAIARRRR